MPAIPASPTFEILAAAVFLAAGVVKGVVGLGLPTVSMALLALFMPPAQAAALLIVPSLATNAWQMRPLRRLPALWRRLWLLQAGACAGTLAGARLLGGPGQDAAGGWLGAALLAYASWGLFGARRPLPPRWERRLALPAGLLTGVVTATTGVFVVPAVPYLQALGLGRDELIQAMGLSFTVSTLALALALGLSGGAAGASAGLSLGMLAPALAGMWVGGRLRERLAPAVFRACLFASLAGLGAWLVIEAAWRH